MELHTCHTPSQREKKISVTDIVLEFERWNTRGHQMSTDSQEESSCWEGRLIELAASQACSVELVLENS